MKFSNSVTLLWIFCNLFLCINIFFACSAWFLINTKQYFWSYIKYTNELKHTCYNLHKEHRGEIRDTVFACQSQGIIKLMRLLFSIWIQLIHLNSATQLFHLISVQKICFCWWLHIPMLLLLSIALPLMLETIPLLLDINFFPVPVLLIIALMEFLLVALMPDSCATDN